MDDSIVCIDMNGTSVQLQYDDKADEPSLCLWAMDEDATEGDNDFMFIQLGLKQSLQIRNALDEFLHTHTRVPTKEQLSERLKSALECLNSIE